MSDREETKASGGPMPGDAVIRCEGLAKTYAEGALRTHVFEGLDLLVHPGETVAIVGVSGSGKSTLLHLLGGLDMPTAGEVYVAGQKMSALSDADRGRLRNRALGFVYQFHHLLPDFNAIENVEIPQLVAGKTYAEARVRAEELLEALGLGARFDHRPSQLSGGEQQRVAVARALANRPALVLADEPTGNLDEATADKVLGQFLELVRGQGSAALVATHNERLALSMDRVVRLHEGVLS